MAEINWGLLDPNTPAKIAGSFYEGQQQRQANALQAQQLEHAQTANMLGKYQLGQAKRADEQQNALAEVYRSAANPQTGAIDSNALMQGLAQRGLGAKIPEVQKQMMEAQKAKISQALEATKLARVGATQVMANPNLSTAMTVLQQLQAQTGMDQSGEIARLQALGDNPEAIKQWAAGHALEADKLLPKLETLNLGGVVRQQQQDPLTGKVIASTDIRKTATPGEIMADSRAREQAAATRDVAAATRDAATAQKQQATEMKLSDDYRSQSKDFGQVQSAYKLINSTLDQASKSPAATLAAATKFMKLLDPGSVVRESELGMALAASGVIDRATNYVNVLQKGKVLTPNQVEDFRNITKQIYAAAQGVQQSIDADYQARAQTYGLNPKNIVQNLGQNDKLDKPKAAGGWSIVKE